MNINYKSGCNFYYNPGQSKTNIQFVFGEKNTLKEKNISYRLSL